MWKVWSIAWKDTLMRFSSRSEWLFFVILPVVFTLALAQQGQGDTRLALLVTDLDGSSLATELVRVLSLSEAIQPTLRPQAEAQTAFDENTAAAWLVIPAGFEQAVTSGEPADLTLYQQPNNTDALAAAQAVRAAINQVSGPLIVARESLVEARRLEAVASPADASAYLAAVAEAARSRLAQTPAEVTVVRPSGATGRAFDVVSHQSAGQLVTWVFIPLLGISGLFAYERTTGTLRRLLTTPTQKATFLLGAIAGQFTLALIQMIILTLFGVWVVKANWGQSIPGLALMMVTFGLASVALGVMLASWVKTEGQANNLSIALGMVMALLGGCWYPVELFSSSLQTATKILPTRWAMQGFSDLVLRGQGWQDVLPEAGVLLGFAVVFLTLGIWRFRYE